MNEPKPAIARTAHVIRLDQQKEIRSSCRGGFINATLDNTDIKTLGRLERVLLSRSIYTTLGKRRMDAFGRKTSAKRQSHCLPNRP